MNEYTATVTVRLHDEINLVELDPVTVRVDFTGPEDPRKMLTVAALRAALAAAESADRFM